MPVEERIWLKYSLEAPLIIVEEDSPHRKPLSKMQLPLHPNHSGIGQNEVEEWILTSRKPGIRYTN
jgi:hypothetical protein